MVDHFSKWVEIHALLDISVEQTARCAVDQLFSRFGSPLQIHTDQGKNFDSNVVKSFCDLYHVTILLCIVLVLMVRLNVLFVASAYTLLSFW